MKELGQQTNRPEKKRIFFRGSNFLGLNFYMFNKIIKCGLSIFATVLCVQIPMTAFGYLPQPLTLTTVSAATVVSSPTSYQAFQLSFTGSSGTAPKLKTPQLSNFNPHIQRLLTFNYNLRWNFATGSTRADRNESLQNVPIMLQIQWIDGRTTRTVDAGILPECKGWREFQVDLQSINEWFSAPTSVTLNLKFVTPSGVDVTDTATLQIRDVTLKSNKYELGMDANLMMARMAIQYFSDYYRLTIQGNNPYIALSGLNATYDPEEHYVVSFDYRKGSANNFTIDCFRVFFWDYPNNPIDGSDYITGTGGTATSQWQTATIYLKESSRWRRGLSRLRIDFGSGSNVGNKIDVRNIRFRRDFSELVVNETSAVKDITVSNRRQGSYTLQVASVSNPDPLFDLEPLEYSDGGYYLDPNDQVYVTFDYTATSLIQNFFIQGYYGDSRDSGPPIGTYGHQLTPYLNLPATVTGDPNYVGTTWRSVAIPLTPVDYYNNGLDAGDRIHTMQFHFGFGAGTAGNQIMIRRMRLTRAPERWWSSWSNAKKNNQRVPDLSDIDLTNTLGNRLPLMQLSNASGSFVQRAMKKISINGILDYETWEKGRYTGGNSSDSVGYPSVVQNIHGASSDGRCYLYYAHHDPTSGIGCMVAASPADTFTRYNRLATGDAALKSWGNVNNSLVLEAYYNGDYITGQTSNYATTTGDPRHFCSPCVVWSREDNLWYMFFHYYDPYPAGETASGSQKTGLAFCADLTLNRWYILRDGTSFDSYIRPILPAFPEALYSNQSWISGQSSYHYIAQLPSGQWLAFMRGTTNDSNSFTTIGVALSSDGINWHYLPDGLNGIGNPVISQTDGATPVGSNPRGQGNYRPHFMLYLGLQDSSTPLVTLNNLYQGIWSEAQSGDGNLQIISGKMPESGISAYLFPASYRAFTDEYLAIQPPLTSQLESGQNGEFAIDGSFSPLRVGNYLYIFIGKDVYRIDLMQL